MTGKRVRDILRIVHLIAAAAIGYYVYAPAENTEGLGVAMKVVIIPVLTITGFWMWQQARIRRWLRRGKPTPTATAAGARGKS